MKVKKVLSILLVVCMLTALFVACNKKEEVKTDPTDSGTVSNDANTPSTGPDFDEDPTEIEFWLYDNGNTGSGKKVGMVQDAINAIMEEEYNIHVNFKWIASADYGTQLNLGIANSETVDVAVFSPSQKYSWLTMYSNNAMLDMSALLDSHGQDVKALLGDELLNATTVDGAIYGLTNYRQLDSSIYLYYREDVLVETGTLDMYKNLSSWSEYEEFLSILAAESGMAATGGAGEEPVLYRGFEFTGDSFDTISTWDMLGDSLNVVWSDQNGNVENMYARETTQNMYKMIAGWNEKGYVYSDSAFNTTESATQLVGYGVFAGGCCMSEFGVDTTKTQQCGTPIVCIAIADNFISTMNCQYFGTYIPATSSEPEAAMTFLNALYTRADLMNLICWGVEGETYEVNDGVAQYIGDADASTSGYHLDDFRLGNQFLILPWSGQTSDFRQRAEDKFVNAPKSAYLGLTVDTSNYDTLVSALSTVRSEYYFQFANGLYTDALYSEFMSRLDAAGVNEYIALYQNAVSEFMS